MLCVFRWICRCCFEGRGCMNLLCILGLCRHWSIIYRSVPVAFMMMEVYLCAVMMGVWRK